MFVKMGISSTGFQGAKDNVRRREQKFAARRKVRPGYPWTGQFETKEQIDFYFSGDKIECLLCGKTYRGLGVHLLKIHGVTDDQYRARYGLPWGRGLTSAASKEFRSKVITSRPGFAEFMRDLSATYQPLTVEAPHRDHMPYLKAITIARNKAGKGKTRSRGQSAKSA
jgi:hypothetical protein